MKLNSETNQSNNRPSAFTKNAVLTALFSIIALLGVYLGTMHGCDLLSQLNQ